MEHKQTLEQTVTTIYNIYADVIIGKNLLMHLTDIYKALGNIQLAISIAKINNEVTSKREELRDELVKLGYEILAQLKKEKLNESINNRSA